MIALLLACSDAPALPPPVPPPEPSDVRPPSGAPRAPEPTRVDAPPRDAAACDAARAALTAARDDARALALRAGVAEAQDLARAQDALARCNADPSCVEDPKQRAARFVDVHDAQVALDGARRPLAEADAAVYTAGVAVANVCGGSP